MTGSTTHPLHILVVDDEKYMRQIACRCLLELGYGPLLEADDGTAAIEILTTRTDVGLVLLDIQMTTLGGLDVLRLIRRSDQASLRALPVVMLTGRSSLDNLKRAAELGIHGFLTKPVSKANLDKQIRRALSSPPLDPAKITVQA